MKVNNFSLSNLEISKLSNSMELKEGCIINGKILDLIGDIVTVDLGNGHYLKGRTLIPLEVNKDVNIKFIIKNVSDSRIIISPVSDIEVGKASEEASIKGILMKNGIESNRKSVEIIKNLMKYKMAMDKKTIESIIKIIDKLECIINLKKNEKIKLIGNDKKLLDEEIERFITIPIKEETGSIKEGNYETDKDKLKYLKSERTIKNRDLTEKFNKVLNSRDLTNIVKSEISKIITDEKNIQELVRNVIFLMKADMKVTINNLKFLSQLIKGNGFINDDIEDLIISLGNNNFLKEEVLKEIKSYRPKVSIDFNEDDKEKIKDYYKELNRAINKIKINLPQKNEILVDTYERIELLGNKINFLNTLNENMTFVFIPMQVSKDEIHEKLYVLNKRKGNKSLDNIKVLISLNTMNLKKVDILCEIIKNDLSVSFNLETKSFISFFRRNEDKLKDMLIKNGFKNIYFKYRNKEEIDILDIFSEDNQTNYLLDVRT